MHQGRFHVILSGMKRIYFDNASTTPVDKRVLDAMLPYFTELFGNPSSVLIEEGGAPRAAVDEARHRVASLATSGLSLGLV